MSKKQKEVARKRPSLKSGKLESPSMKLYRAELSKHGLFKGQGGDYDGLIGDTVMVLLKCLHGRGHSGCSASISAQVFERLVTVGNLDQANPVDPVENTKVDTLALVAGLEERVQSVEKHIHEFKSKSQSHPAGGYLAQAGSAFNIRVSPDGVELSRE